MFEEITGWIEQNFRIGYDIQTNLLATLVVIVLLLLSRQVINLFVRRRTEDAQAIYRWRKVSEYITLALAVIALILIWLPDTRSFATYLGLLSAGLAIALQDPITDFVGWIFIVARRPFVVGARIQIGDHAGDVVDIRYFQFSILEIGNWVDADQSTGRVMHIPNKRIFTDAVANYGEGLAFIWNELVVDVTFESDWVRAKEVLQAIAVKHGAQKGQKVRKHIKDAADRYFISYDKLTPIVYTSVIDIGVRLTIRYLVEPRRRRGTANAIWEDILLAFAAEPAIDFAYPTIRRYDHEVEGKPALRPDVVYGEE